jgi:hypothetical protein
MHVTSEELCAIRRQQEGITLRFDSIREVLDMGMGRVNIYRNETHLGRDIVAPMGIASSTSVSSNGRRVSSRSANSMISIEGEYQNLKVTLIGNQASVTLGAEELACQSEE